jgi:hypothetical protein
MSRIWEREIFESDLRPIIAALKILPDPRMIRALIWPLCVARCMASTPSDQQVFRELAQNGVKDAGSFGNCGEALMILESSWGFQRGMGRPVDCGKTIQTLGKCVLLV